MDFEKICMMFAMDEPYYGIILSSMRRMPVPASVVPTLGVARDGNVFKLGYNPDYVSKLDVSTTMACLKHECLHVAFNHFGLWENENVRDDIKKLRNVAADLEVNSYINPETVHDIKILRAEQFGWENELGAREYFRRLMDEAMNQQQKAQAQNPNQPCNGGQGGQDQQNQNQNQNQQQQNGNGSGNGNGQQSQSNGDGNGNGQGQQQPQQGSGNGQGSGSGDSELSQEFMDGLNEFDDHSQWPDKREAETTEQMIEDLLLQAAEETEKSCGTIPAEMRMRIDDIRKKKKPKPAADWKRYVRRYLGHEFSEFIRKSKKRESRRFPDAAGNRHRRKSHILVAIDTSGSISMPEYLEFFGQIKTLTATATFDIVECDADIQKIYQFRGHPNMDVHGGGGTSFQPVVDMYVKEKKKYDALIYFTDGYCSVPLNTPKDTLWVMSSNGNISQKEMFKRNGASVVVIPAKD